MNLQDHAASLGLADISGLDRFYAKQGNKAPPGMPHNADKWQKFLSDRDHGRRHENILSLLTTPDARQNFLGYMHPWTTAFLTVKPDRSTELGNADFIEWIPARVGLTPLPRGADSCLCKSTQMLIVRSNSAQHASCCNEQQALATTRHTAPAKAMERRPATPPGTSQRGGRRRQD